MSYGQAMAQGTAVSPVGKVTAVGDLATRLETAKEIRKMASDTVVLAAEVRGRLVGSPPQASASSDKVTAFDASTFAGEMGATLYDIATALDQIRHNLRAVVEAL